jgi:hypothetical protein
VAGLALAVRRERPVGIVEPGSAVRHGRGVTEEDDPHERILGRGRPPPKAGPVKLR